MSKNMYLVLKVTKVQMQRDKDFVRIVSQARSKIFTVFHYGTQWIRLAVMWEENFSPDNVFSSALWQYGMSNFFEKDTKLDKFSAKHLHTVKSRAIACLG